MSTLIGATTSAVAHVASAIATGHWYGFWHSVGFGAFSGALGGALGWAGSSLGLAKVFNNVGYNIISQTTNNIVTNVAFGNGIKLNDMFGIAAGAALGTVLPTYKATQGGWFRNSINETIHNTARGAITGGAQGLVDWAVKGERKYFFQDVIGGGISGFSRTVAMNVILGAPYLPKVSSLSQGHFRTGGLSSILLNKKGVTLGQNLYVSDGNDDISTMFHEYEHYDQQLDSNRGWAGFYGQWLIELLSNLGHSVYNVNGTLENQAENAALNNYREYWF